MANQPKKYKKFVATAATATLVASAIVPVASAASLSDIAGNTHEEAINALVDAKVISGYPDGTFKPNKTLTRSDVVKLLGKYLETQGFEPAGNYKTSPAFKDLKTTSNEELLKYASVVKEAGVFAGSNGNLLAGDSITRENMAIVLVRMINTLKDVSLEEYVASQDFDGDVTDLEQAKAEARTAIAVLDFYDITNPAAPVFNPKGDTTRGQFASFLNKTINADYAGASATTGTVKAINATTVEVTFGEEVADIKALDFKIEGLEVKNAVVKQTDKKTVVLTTATQTAGKEYTVVVNENTVGKFVGISAVIPTAVKMLTPSVQGTIGKEATVKAQVEVPAGQSKAGIPVTFNIVNGTVNQLNEKIEVVAYTNEEGIATHSYTRYYKYDDNVTAYATEKSSVFASGKVYWAQALTITEVTEGNTLANGAKKVYKIKTDTSVTETLGTSATSDDYNYVNVAFLENVDVAPDKLVRGVEVIDTGLSTNAKYPSQVTTGGVQVVRVKVNANGEGTFTLTGSNGSVTPVVFVDESTKQVGKYTTTALQAAAPAVKFELNHTLGLSVKAEGVQNAAAINTANLNNKGTGEGGREYTVTITDKNGKVAPAGTVAYVTFQENNYSTDKKAYILDANDNRVLITKNMTAQPIKVTGTKGEATFTVVGEHDAFAAPTVFLENGKEAGLDKDDLQVVGETTYFVDAVINNASLKVRNADGKEVETLPSTQSAFFHYNSVDQNGFDYYAGTGSYEVSYQVTAHFADVTVYGSPFGSKVVKKGTTETVKVNSVAGKAKLEVRSENVASNVTVQASASLVSLPNQTAAIEFTKGSQVPNVYTGNVESINKVDNKLKFVGFDAITYSTSSFKNAQGVVISESQFETLVSDALAANSVVKVTSVKNTDGTYTLEIESITGSADVPVTATSAIALDQNRDGFADAVEVTFSKPVNPAKFAVADFTVTDGAVTGGSVAAGSSTNKLVISFGTPASDLSVGTLTIAAVTDAGTDLSDLAATSVVVTDADANLPAFAGNLVTTISTGVTDGTNATRKVNTVTLGASPDLTTTGVVTVAGNGFSKNFNFNAVASDTAAQTAEKIYNAVKDDATVKAYYDVAYTAGGTAVTFTNKVAGAGNASDLVTIANAYNTAITSTPSAGLAAVAETFVIDGFTTSGTVTAGILEATISKGGSKLATVSINVAAGATGAGVTAQLYAALLANPAVTTNYTVTYDGSDITLTNKVTGVVTGTANATSVTIQP